MGWADFATALTNKSDALFDRLFFWKASKQSREIANLSAALDVVAKAKAIGEDKLARTLVDGLERSLGDSAAEMQGHDTAEGLPRQLPGSARGRARRRSSG